MHESLVSRKEVCERLHISKGTIGNMVRRGDLPYPISVGRFHYFPKDVIEQIEREGTRGQKRMLITRWQLQNPTDKQ